MIYAIIENNEIKNTIVADKKFINQFYKGALDITDLKPQPGIGWTLVDDVWIAPIEPEIIDETIPE